ncbi:ankyrin repeat and sterile alpha motif domain-containing protein 1B isoform 1 [Cricetulus griseus]|nr:ankyrin repeat and sterile alpha motif domain-containing protein 1B isoform 1 [Cricetulus griseus]
MLIICVIPYQYPHHINYFRSLDDLSQQEDNDPPKEYEAGQFAGLLHGSSPACESPENPFHLYGKRNQCEDGQDEASLANSPLPFKQTPIGNNSEPVVKKIKPKVVSRTIFHKRSHQLENHTIVGTRTSRSGSRSGDQWGMNTGGFVERACTLGRIRSLPKALIDMHLSKNVSKSDSDLIAYPSKDKARVNWSEPSTAEHSSKDNSERTPSFTSEWAEIDKIMNSIDVGINSELEEMNGQSSGSHFTHTSTEFSQTFLVSHLEPDSNAKKMSSDSGMQ